MLNRRFDRGSGYGGDHTHRNDEDSYYRGNSRDRATELYDYSRRRSPSPRRAFGDKGSSWDNRSKGRNAGSNDWQDDRGRNRNARTPPNQRAGLLGAAPGEMPSSSIGGQTGVNSQVLAALQAQQTQAWLAALQANQMQLNSGNANNFNNQNRSQGSRWNNNRKRFDRQEPTGPLQKRRRDDYRQGYRQHGRDNQRRIHSKSPQRSSRDSKSTAYNPAEPTSDGEEGKSGKELILAELCEKVEQLRKREKIERNISDQDVDKLVLFSFDGEVYKCDVCDVICKSAESLRAHLMTKKHSLAVIEERADGKDPCRDIMDIDLKPDDWFDKSEVARVLLEKQATALELAKQEQRRRDFEENPANYVNYTLNTRKVATKNDKAVVITHTAEVSVHINDFASDQHMFGCEFVNTVVGFTCQLCKMLINQEDSVIEHIKSIQHKENYKEYVEQNKEYEETQSSNNQKLEQMLSRNQHKLLLLHESFETDNTVYLRKKDAKVVLPDADIPTWCEVSSLVEKPEETEDAEEDLDANLPEGEEEQAETAEDDLSEKDADVDLDEMVDSTGIEEPLEEEVMEEDEVADEELTPKETKRNSRPSIIKAEVIEPEAVVVEPEVVKKETATPVRIPQRRAVRGGAQARRGRGRGTPKARNVKVRTTAVVATPTTDDYDVIDDVQDDC